MKPERLQEIKKLWAEQGIGEAEVIEILACLEQTQAVQQKDKDYIAMANKFIDLNNLTKLWWIYLDQKRDEAHESGIENIVDTQL